MKKKQEDSLRDLYSALKKGKNPFPNRQVRDLTLIHLGGEYSLVIAVDSDGGIGSMPADVVTCSNYTLGRFAMRVPLIEILACGAYPLAAFDMLTLPMQPHGVEIIRGIREEFAEAGLDADFPLSGSTEDNIPTTMTGIGTLVLGMVTDPDFRPGTSQPGDRVLCLGLPKSGPEDTVRLEDVEIVKLSQLRQVMVIKGVHDVLPVGSRGALYEAGQMAELAGLRFCPADQERVNLHKSGGPSTCVLLSCPPETMRSIVELLSVPVTLIGNLTHE